MTMKCKRIVTGLALIMFAAFSNSAHAGLTVRNSCIYNSKIWVTSVSSVWSGCSNGCSSGQRRVGWWSIYQGNHAEIWTGSIAHGSYWLYAEGNAGCTLRETLVGRGQEHTLSVLPTLHTTFAVSPGVVLLTGRSIFGTPSVLAAPVGGGWAVSRNPTTRGFTYQITKDPLLDITTHV